MNNKSNIILIIIGTFLSSQLCFARFFTFLSPIHLIFGHHHHHFITGSLGLTSLVGIGLIALGLYNIFKENNKPNINQPVNQNENKI